MLQALMRPLNSASASADFACWRVSHSCRAFCICSRIPFNTDIAFVCSEMDGIGMVRDFRLVGLMLAWLTPGVAKRRIRD